MTRIGINGFGRIGRLTLRCIRQYHREDLEVVAINDLGTPSTLAHLFKWDTTYGPYPGQVSITDGSLWIDNQRIATYAEKDPSRIPWQAQGVEIVIEATGRFTDASKAAGHFAGGVSKVIVSAPAQGEDITIVLGVNEENYRPTQHHIISNASCTTNCVAPIVKVLNQSFGVRRGLMTTIHSYTNDQCLQDSYHHDLRRARAATENIIPTTTGAAKTVGVVIPELEGRLHGIAFRVPVSTVSVVDLVVELDKSTTVEEINHAFYLASCGPLKGIIDYCEEPLVSSDFRGNPASAVIDAPSTMLITENMAKVIAWYDNEWGYSSRLADLASYLISKELAV